MVFGNGYKYPLNISDIKEQNVTGVNLGGSAEIRPCKAGTV